MCAQWRGCVACDVKGREECEKQRECARSLAANMWGGGAKSKSAATSTSDASACGMLPVCACVRVCVWHIKLVAQWS